MQYLPAVTQKHGKSTLTLTLKLSLTILFWIRTTYVSSLC